LLRSDLVSDNAPFRILRDAPEHDRFLLELLGNVQKEIHIVTPWIRRRQMEDTGAMAAMCAAIARGASVHVYTDPEFNIGNPDSQQRKQANQQKLQQTMGSLTAAGIEANYVERMHSKLVWADDRVICAGSFNWFSAQRQGDYVRHETSFVYEDSTVAKEIATSLQS